MKRFAHTVALTLAILTLLSGTALAKTVYVMVNCPVYASPSTSAKKFGTLKVGTKLDLKATQSGWGYVTSGKYGGFVKTSYISTITSYGGKTVYASKDVTAYKAYSTSSGKVGTIEKGTKLSLIAVAGDWAYVKRGSAAGFVKVDALTTKAPTGKAAIVSTATPAKGKAISADWWDSGINSAFSKGSTAVVTDVGTKLAFRVKRCASSNHADVEPLTVADALVMYKIYGYEWKWDRRPIYVTIGGKNYAASMNGMPHDGESTISNNGFDGVFCIHFTNSRTHSGDSVDSDHQDAIKKALSSNL